MSKGKAKLIKGRLTAEAEIAAEANSGSDAEARQDLDSKVCLSNIQTSHEDAENPA